MAQAGFHRAAIVACLALAAAGCGDDGKPPMGSVTGTVTYKGEPLTPGSVIFSPVNATEEQPGQPATGQLASDGSYRLTTFDDGDGAIVGEHIVTVQASETVTTKKATNVEGIRVEQPDGSLAFVGSKSRIPARFSKPAETPLRFTVKEGSNTFDITIED